MRETTATTTAAPGLDDVPSLVAAAAARWPDDECLRFDQTGERLTFGEFHRRTNGVAHQLAALGVCPGDRVAVMISNRAAFPLSWIGILKAGAVMVPINTFAKEADAGHIAQHSGAVVLIMEPRFGQLGTHLLAASPHLRTLIFSEAAEDGPEGTATLAREERDEPPHPTYLPESLANIQYTSGTTGKPKGCMLSNRYWVRLSQLVVEHPPHLTKSDVLLTAQPFSYMDPQWNLLAGLRTGAAVVVLDRFHPSTFWSKVKEHGATFFYCLGAMPNLMARMPPSPLDRDHQVRYVACSAIPTHLHRELEQRFGAPWFELFGSTETGGDLTVHPDERAELIGSACIGRPFPHREVRIVDDDDRPLPREEVGEIVLRGHSMMDGYFLDPDATAETFRSGWFHTGDLGRMDGDGRVYFHGRKKDIIRRSGENVSAVEVESTVGNHPDVRLVACIAVPDDLRGEEIKALVVRQPGSVVGPRELADFCSEKLAYFKVPRFWEFREELPMTTSEKIAKADLRAELNQGNGTTYDVVDDAWS